MKKCVACGKNALIVEKLGTADFCVGCFGKIKGFLWKTQYDKYEDAEKQRCYALDLAHKNLFPQPAISEINNFFVSQMHTMRACDCCKTKVQALQKIGIAKICAVCYKKINNAAWKKTEFEDNDEVEISRQKVISVAEKHNYPQSVIQGINKHFDKKLQDGLLCVVKSDCGQKIKVFTNRVQIVNLDEFDREEMSIEYGKLQFNPGKKHNHSTTVSASDLARNALKAGSVIKTAAQIIKPGGIAKATINLALSYAESSSKNHKAEEQVCVKGVFKSFGKSINLDYEIYDRVDYRKCRNDNVGFIRFARSNAEGQATEDVLFFFDCDDEKIDKAYDLICERIEYVKQSKMAREQSRLEEQREDATGHKSETVSVADEILKFKNLLDIGAISQEEYDIKKKELLNN